MLSSRLPSPVGETQSYRKVTGWYDLCIGFAVHCGMWQEVSKEEPPPRGQKNRAWEIEVPEQVYKAKTEVSWENWMYEHSKNHEMCMNMAKTLKVKFGEHMVPSPLSACGGC